MFIFHMLYAWLYYYWENHAWISSYSDIAISVIIFNISPCCPQIVFVINWLIGHNHSITIEKIKLGSAKFPIKPSLWPFEINNICVLLIIFMINELIGHLRLQNESHPYLKLEWLNDFLSYYVDISNSDLDSVLKERPNLIMNLPDLARCQEKVDQWDSWHKRFCQVFWSPKILFQRPKSLRCKIRFDRWKGVDMA